MRAIHLSDLHHAACALRAIPEGERALVMHNALCAADTADRYRKATGRSHPTFGYGTLSSTFGPVVEPASCDSLYCDAMAVVIATLQRR